MENNKDAPLYRAVRERVHQRFHFYQHLVVFALVGGVLLSVDLLHHILEGGREPFVPWVVGIWGSILAGHFIYAFVISRWLGSEAQCRVTTREVRRLEKSLGGEQ